MAAGRSDNLLRSVAAAARQVKWRNSRWERSCRSAFSSSASQRNAVHGGDSAASLRAWPAFFRRWLTERGFVAYASKSAPGDSSSLRGPCILRLCAGVHGRLGLENRRRGSWGRDATALSTAAAFSCCESAAGLRNKVQLLLPYSRKTIRDVFWDYFSADALLSAAKILYWVLGSRRLSHLNTCQALY
jgi:hypothetical protein